MQKLLLKRRHAKGAGSMMPFEGISQLSRECKLLLARTIFRGLSAWRQIAVCCGLFYVKRHGSLELNPVEGERLLLCVPTAQNQRLRAAKS